MNKSDIVKKLAKESGLSKVKAGNLVDQMFSIMQSTLQSGDQVMISGFGTFSISVRKKRMARNPRNGDPVMLHERNKVVFKASKHLQNLVNT